MRRLILALCGVVAGVLTLLAPAQANAWGRYGHLTVCDLAYRNLTPASRTALKDLLQSRTGGITVKGRGKLADRHYTSFNLGCLEEDALPRRHSEDHFINVPRTATAITETACPPAAECILVGIRRDLAILKDMTKSREDRVFALMAVGHWVGDIHQPLHISFADDRGGNGIDARVAGHCGASTYRATNLHAVWDNCILEAGMFERVRNRADYQRALARNKPWGPNTITYRAVDTLQANTTLTEETSLVGTDPVAWANESYQITLDPKVLYCVQTGGACRYSTAAAELTDAAAKRNQPIDQAYLAAFDQVAQDRVKRAGFRLAHLLNLALDPNYTQPLQDRTQRP